MVELLKPLVLPFVLIVVVFLFILWLKGAATRAISDMTTKAKPVIDSTNKVLGGAFSYTPFGFGYKLGDWLYKSVMGVK